MTEVKDIYNGAERLINDILRKEIVAQGHHLTGAYEDSLTSEVTVAKGIYTMAGLAVYYSQYVEHGFPARSASMRQFPFLLEYFIKRGYPIYSTSGAATAGNLAAATIKKWMRDGMSTLASARFSATGARQHAIENAFFGNATKLDEYMGNALDFMFEEDFQKEKSERI